jgi:uncharacterized membrane protein
MNIKKSLLIQGGMLLLGFLYSLYMNAQLPDRVPTHWNINNQPDAWGPKSTLLYLGLGILLLGPLLTWAIPKLSPKNFGSETFGETYSTMMLLVQGMFLAIHYVILRSALGDINNIGNVLMAVVFAFFAFFGNQMGRIKRNFYMGVRTPWTLASERVWLATHRRAGRLWFFGGIAGVLFSLLPFPMYVPLTALILMSFAPVIDSYLLSKKLEPDESPQ